jgi:hypothetical protein
MTVTPAPEDGREKPDSWEDMLKMAEQLRNPCDKVDTGTNEPVHELTAEELAALTLADWREMMLDAGRIVVRYQDGRVASLRGDLVRDREEPQS